MSPVNGPLPSPLPPRLDESAFIVYRWEDGEMYFARRLFVRHCVGERVTPEMVREQVYAELHDFKPAKYRAVPQESMVDFEVKGEVVLS